MNFLDSNQYALEEVFASPVAEAFEHLQRIGTLYPLSPYTASMENLTGSNFGVGSKWREHRRHLFLRDVTECEVVECNAPASFSIVTNDGELHHPWPLTAQNHQARSRLISRCALQSQWLTLPAHFL